MLDFDVMKSVCAKMPINCFSPGPTFSVCITIALRIARTCAYQIPLTYCQQSGRFIVISSLKTKHIQRKKTKHIACLYLQVAMKYSRLVMVRDEPRDAFLVTVGAEQRSNSSCKTMKLAICARYLEAHSHFSASCS